MRDMVSVHLKRILQALWVYSGLAFLLILFRRSRREILILLYHRVNDVNTPFYSITDRLSVHTRYFERQMRFLRRFYHVMSLEDAVACLQGKERIARGSVVVTFDDGYWDNYEYAWPILERWDIPAIIFIATAFAGGERYFWWDVLETLILEMPASRWRIDLEGSLMELDLSTRRRRVQAFWEIYHQLRPLDSRERDEQMNRLQKAAEFPHRAHARTLTWEELRCLRRNGMALGAHTHSHAMLSALSEEEVRQEVLTSRSLLKRQGGGPITAFAYPVGHRESFPAEMTSLLKKEGFSCGVTTIQGRVRMGDDPYMLKRINVSGIDSMISFWCRISGIDEGFRWFKDLYSALMKGTQKGH